MAIKHPRIRRLTNGLLNPATYLPAIKRRLGSRAMIVVVGSAHKVGSTWLYELLLDLNSFERGSLFLPGKFKELGTVRFETQGADEYLQNLTGFRIFKTHSYPIGFDDQGPVRLVSVYRDPRDVIASSIFYLAHLDADRGGWGNDFAALSETNRVKHFIRNGEFAISRLEAWYKTPGIFQVSYEDLKLDPEGELRRVQEHLDLPVDPKSITKIIERHSFKRRAGRAAGNADAGAFLRKGVTGDWLSHFDEEAVTLFKTHDGGRWNQLLLEMGYEQNPDWGLHDSADQRMTMIGANRDPA